MPFYTVEFTGSEIIEADNPEYAEEICLDHLEDNGMNFDVVLTVREINSK